MIVYQIWIGGMVVGLMNACAVVYQQKGSSTGYQVAIIFALLWPFIFVAAIGMVTYRSINLFVEKLTSPRIKLPLPIIEPEGEVLP